MANRTITSVQIALPIVRCLPAVSRHSRLFEARVTPDVSHGSRLVNPWISEGARLPGRASDTVSDGARLVNAWVTPDVPRHARLIYAGITTTTVSDRSRLVETRIPLGLHARFQPGE